LVDNMEKQQGGGFFVRMPLDETLKLIKEIGHGPFALYFWLCGRVTREYSATAIGIRVGAVLGSVPLTDLSIADDLTRAGYKCDRFQVCKWRRRLADSKLIAWVRTPAGVRIFVIGSDKFPQQDSEPLPEWAASSIAEAFREPVDKLSESTHQVVRTDTSSCQNRHIQYKKRSRNEKETKSKDGSSPSAEEDLAFDSPRLKVTWEQWERIVNSPGAAGLTFPELYQEFDAAEEWAKSKGIARIERPVAFMRKWFARIGKPDGAKQQEPGVDIPLAEPEFDWRAPGSPAPALRA
jgi:hypothetical protein